MVITKETLIAEVLDYDRELGKFFLENLVNIYSNQ